MATRASLERNRVNVPVFIRLCPSNERSIWPHNCYSAMDMSAMEPEMDDMAGMGSVVADEDKMNTESMGASDTSGAGGWRLYCSFVLLNLSIFALFSL